jgi:hypothetical protein
MKESVYWKKAIEIDENLNCLGWPNRDAQAERNSFILQANRREKCEIPSDEQRKAALDKLKCKYSCAKFSINFSDFSINSVYKMCEQVFPKIKRESTPGIPYSSYSQTNGELLDSSWGVIKHLVYSRIQCRLNWNGEQLTPAQMVQRNLCDPIRIFVKQEPHKKKKLQEGRVRLIMAVSIVDKIIEMILEGTHKEVEITNWKDVPSKPGIGFEKTIAKEFYNTVVSKPKRVSSDAQGWDWSVRQWMQDDYAKFVNAQCLNSFKEYEELLAKSAKISGNSLFHLTDGTLLVVDEPGLQNSGKFATSKGNSFMRVLVATVVGSEENDAMGDDLIETYVENAVEKYKKYGITIKGYEPFEKGENFEFCSNLFTPNGCYPIEMAKSVMNLLHHVNCGWEDIAGFTRGIDELLECHPRRSYYMDLIDQTGFNVQVGEQKILLKDNIPDESLKNE